MSSVKRNSILLETWQRKNEWIDVSFSNSEKLNYEFLNFITLHSTSTLGKSFYLSIRFYRKVVGKVK